MDSCELDDSQHITVKCQYCNKYCSLMDYKRHRAMHSEETCMALKVPGEVRLNNSESIKDK